MQENLSRIIESIMGGVNCSVQGSCDSVYPCLRDNMASLK